MNPTRFFKVILTLSFATLFLVSTSILLYSAWVSDFDSDELSSILRAHQADNFIQHIQTGVLPDGHPAGVQSIIWFGTHFGGCSPFCFRLIWVIFTILGNIYFKKWLYKIAKKNGSEEHVANWISIWGYAFISLMWWPLSLGSWLRPYVPGFAVFMFFLNQFELLNNKSNSWIWTGIFLGLLGYIHYFTLLTGLVFFIVSWGWDFGFKSSKTFMKIAAIAIIINLPQLLVIQHQLQLAGLNWLGKPTPQFFIVHLKYITGSNFWIQWIFLFVIVLRLILIPPKWNSIFIKNILIWLCVFIILYTYSIFRKPVLQHNALYFAFPLLISFFIEMLVAFLNFINQKINLFQSKYTPNPTETTNNNPITNLFKKQFNSMGELVNSIILIFSILLMLNNTVFEKLYFADIRIHDRYAEPFRIVKDYKLNERNHIQILVDGPSDVLSYHKTHFLQHEQNINNLFFIQSLYHPQKDKTNPLGINSLSKSSKLEVNSIPTQQSKYNSTQQFRYPTQVNFNKTRAESKSNPNQIWLDWTQGLWGQDTMVLALNSGSNLNIINILNHRSRRINLPWGRKNWVHRTVGGEIQCFVRNSEKARSFVNPDSGKQKVSNSTKNSFANKELSKSVVENKDFLNKSVAENIDAKSIKRFNIRSSEPIFIDLKPFSIQPYDLIGIRFTSKNLTLDSIKLVSALFKEGFNKAKIQYDYRWEQGSTDSSIYLTLKLIDIPEWNPNSSLRLSLEVSGTLQSNNGSISKDLLDLENCLYEIEILPGNPFTYGI
jgi:hypothetical protein